MTSPSPASLEAPWRAGLRSARANLVPGLVLQAFALALVGSYYFIPSVQAALTDLATWRTRVGIVSSIVSTALFGGLLPWLYLRLNPVTRNRFNVAQGFGLIVFWGYKGIEIDLLYKVLAATVGEGNDVATIATKTVIDQFVYNPLLAIPGMWFAYAYLESRYQFGPVWARVRAGGWIRREALPVFIANFGVWCPVVIIIYLLPTPLQLPLENIVLCFFTLMMAHLTQTKPAAATVPLAG